MLKMEPQQWVVAWRESAGSDAISIHPERQDSLARLRQWGRLEPGQSNGARPY